jgi:hypothetical protein
MHLIVYTKFHYFKIVPPASPYIIIPPCGIIIYELAGGNITTKRNVVDPTFDIYGVKVVYKTHFSTRIPNPSSFRVG